MTYKTFEELPVWKKSLQLTKSIYDYSSNNKWGKDFGLRDQIRRAVISISSNIVEGFEKNNNNEFCRFLRIAKGSCGEVRNQIYIAYEVGYITQEECEQLQKEFSDLGNQIGGILQYLIQYKKQKDKS